MESMIDAPSIPVPRTVDLTSFDHGPDDIHVSFPGTLLGNIFCLASGLSSITANRSKCSSSFLHPLSPSFPFPMAKLIVRGRK